MHISQIQVKNFRLLKEIVLSLEENSTVIVGRNNSGKTSLTELLKRLLIDSTPKFNLEDFNLDCISDFWRALKLKNDGETTEAAIRAILPSIQVLISFSYSQREDLRTLNDFVIDLVEGSYVAKAHIEYRLKDGELDSFLAGFVYSEGENEEKCKAEFIKGLKERIQKLYHTQMYAVDPNDPSNTKFLELSLLKELIQTGIITAQRGLDDITHKESNTLGRVLERLFSAASSEGALTSDKENAKRIDGFVKELQTKLDTDFTEYLTQLLPGLKLFGYPGLNDPKLRAETVLNIESLLGDFTKLKYANKNGLGLPETYNGLGSRNLIYILFQLFEFYKSFKSKPVAPCFHLVFIEEPEAHLHPQMQEVFIRQLNEISKVFSEQFADDVVWPVQFVVTTHSTHMANEANLEAIRYFLNTNTDNPYTKIKDLREGFSKEPMRGDKEFLHKFLTLTSCDLFFCDKAILVEGPTERLLMPKFIEKIDSILGEGQNLGSQYVTIMEVGGAYSHRFYNLIDFLELKSLIITDLDSVRRVEVTGPRRRVKYVEDLVSNSTHTSNSSIKKWFSPQFEFQEIIAEDAAEEDEEVDVEAGDQEETPEGAQVEEAQETVLTPARLLGKTTDEKTYNKRRLCYQIPEGVNLACGRSFEEAFLLANQGKFEITGDEIQKELIASKKAKKVKKTKFAIKFATEDEDWSIPKYINEGLVWLANNPNTITDVAMRTVVQAEALNE